MDEDHLPVHITNHWSTDQRLSLLILYRFFSNSWREFGLIFDSAFRCDLQNQGFINHPIPYIRVRTQWHDLMIKRGPEFSQVYEDVSFTEGISMGNPLYDLLQRMRLSAYNIGLSLRTRTHEDSQILKKFDKIRRRDCYQKYFHHSISPVLEEPNENEEAPLSKPTADITNSTDLIAIPVANLPPLLFRCYDETSQGYISTSGFGATKSSPERAITFPSIEDSRLLHEAENHMQHWNLVPTALISTTSSLIFAFKKARDCLQRGGLPQIVAIDTRALANSTRVYPAASLCSQLKSRGSVHFRYRGAYEFLIWQSIPQNAILGSFGYCDLRNKAHVMKDLGDLLQMNIIEDESLKRTVLIRKALAGNHLSESHGRAIAQLALIIRDDAFPSAWWVADFVDVVIQNWRLKETQPWRENREFLAGLHHGFQNQLYSQTPIAQSQATMLITPPATPVKPRQPTAPSAEGCRLASLGGSSFSSHDLPLQCQEPATGDQTTESTLVGLGACDNEMGAEEAGRMFVDSMDEYLEGY